MTHDEMIAVIEADRRHEVLQWKPFRESEWLDLGNMSDESWAHFFNFAHYAYRVKPSPLKPREYFIRLNRAGLLGNLGNTVAYTEEQLTSGRWDDGDQIIHVIEVLPES